MMPHDDFSTKRFSRFMAFNALLYGLLLVPTVFCLLTLTNQDAIWSQQATTFWQAGFWHFSAGTANSTRIVLDILQALVIALMGWSFYSNRTAHPTQKQALTACFLFSLLLVAVIPFHSSDLYGYLNRAFQQTLFQSNPYTTTIAQLPNWQNNPVLHAHWIDNPCPYGVFFAWLVRQLALLGQNTFWITTLLLKTLMAMAVVASTWLIGELATLNGQKKPWTTAFWFGCNPLVLLHAVGNGHNDILMSVLLLAALWLILKPGKSKSPWAWGLAWPLIGLSVLTKYATVITVPFIMLFYLWKKKFYSLLAGLLLLLVLTGLLFWPYYNPSSPWQLADMMSNAGKSQHSLTAMLADSLDYLARLCSFFLPTHSSAIQALLHQSLSTLKLFFGVAFTGLFLWCFAQSCRKPLDTRRLLWQITLLLTAVVLASAKFHPWYPVMVLPFALVLPEHSRLRQFWMWVSLLQLAGFTVFQNLHVISPLIMLVLPIWPSWRKTIWT
jgi:alpha-1,6-mannosyltransferase